MKYLPLLIVTGLIPLFPLCAEDADVEEMLSASSASFPLQEEEAPLSSLEEELSLLDEEFEEFKEELFSLENELKKKESVSEQIAQETPNASLFEMIQEKDAELSSITAPNIANSENDSSLNANERPALIENENLQTLEFSPVSLIDSSKDEDKVAQDFPAILNVQGTSLVKEPVPQREPVIVDLNQAFSGSPIIYSILLAMSVVAVGIWFYSMLSLRNSMRISGTLFRNVQNKLTSNHFEEALSICTEQNNLLCKMVASGILSRRHGLPVMIEAMKAEGKRASIAFWQKLGLLNDIAIIAPMIGLLGTVLGMFYAFYDINRSIESISTLFDGLGISVGTTVAGLIVAILALILHSTAKYRLVRALAQVENEAQNVATLIDDRTSIYKG